MKLKDLFDSPTPNYDLCLNEVFDTVIPVDKWEQKEQNAIWDILI